jgi:hypothetical protein
MKRDDDIFRHFLDATAPLLLWALHFFAAYAFAAAACDSALANKIWVGQPAILLILAIATTAVLLAMLLLLVRAVKLCRIAPWQLLPGARLGLAVLGLLALAWVAVPLFILPVCME